MWAKHKQQPGFTIVELLIVVVVIAILAAITIVAYSGIQKSTRESAVSSALSQAAKKIATLKVTTGTFPASFASTGINETDTTKYGYFPNDSATPTGYCLTATNGNTVFSINNVTKKPQEGDCTVNNLAGWWQFNGNTNDSSQNGNNATMSGTPTLTTGANGNANSAYSFTTAIQRINASVPAIHRNLTLSAWVFPTSYPTERSAIIQGRYFLSLSSDGSLQSYWYSKSSPGYHATGANAVALNQWNHVVATWDATEAKLYVNGSLLRTVPNTGEGDATTSILIGAQASNRQFLGSIDDVRIYDRALTAEQISSSYAAGAL